MVEKPITQEFFEQNVEMAYKAGRAIIADETADRTNQYYTGMVTCSTQIKQNLNELKTKVEKLEGLLSKEGADWSSKIEELKKYCHALHKGFIEDTSTTMNEIDETLRNLTDYSKSMERIAKVPQANWCMKVDVGRTIEAVIDNFQESLDENGIKLQTNPLATPTVMYLNPFWLGRILKGLMKDATQRLLEVSTENKCMYLEFKVENDELKLSVSHNGLPIQKEEIFSMFSISAAGHDALHSMYFFSNLVQRMKGRMNVEMEDNSPLSCITAYFPLNRDI